MSNTYRGSGHRRPYTNATSTAIESGDVVDMVDDMGIALTDIAATGDDGDSGELEVSGVHELAAGSSATWSIGDTLYWTGSALTATASGSVQIGIAHTAKLNGQTTNQVLLNGRCGPSN